MISTRSGITVLLALVLGCGGAGSRLSPLEGYSKARADAPAFEDISTTCQEQAAFRDARGTSWTDWDQFERCMNEHGWTRAPAGAGEPGDTSAAQ